MLFLDFFILALFTYFSLRYHSKLPSFFHRFVSHPSPSLVQSAFNYIWSIVLELLPVFSSVFFGSPALSSEIESRTAFNVFPLPVSRYTLHLGKFFAALTATALVLLIFGAGQYLNYLYIFHSTETYSFFLSLGLALVFGLAVLSITFLVSAIYNKNLYAYITVFLLYFLVFNAVNLVFEFLYNYTPPLLLSNAADIILEVFINIDPFAFTTSFSISPASSSAVVFDLSVMLLYTFVALALSLLIFDRREIK